MLSNEEFDHLRNLSKEADASYHEAVVDEADNSDMRNLLTETTEWLQQLGYTTADVKWIGIAGNSTRLATWDEFAALANHAYDSGYGIEYVNRELLVVGDNWWLERNNYDGSEWWEYRTLPQKQANPDKLTFEDIFPYERLRDDADDAEQPAQPDKWDQEREEYNDTHPRDQQDEDLSDELPPSKE